MLLCRVLRAPSLCGGLERDRERERERERSYTLGSNKISWVARPLFGTDWPSKTKQKFAHMITLMPKHLKQTWGMMLPRCIYIAWGKTYPLAAFTDGRRSAVLGWKKSCPQSQAALDWLNYVSATEHIFIQHAGNTSGGGGGGGG